MGNNLSMDRRHPLDGLIPGENLCCVFRLLALSHKAGKSEVKTDWCMHVHSTLLSNEIGNGDREQATLIILEPVEGKKMNISYGTQSFVVISQC